MSNLIGKPLRMDQAVEGVLIALESVRRHTEGVQDCLAEFDDDPGSCVERFDLLDSAWAEYERKRQILDGAAGGYTPIQTADSMAMGYSYGDDGPANDLYGSEPRREYGKPNVQTVVHDGFTLEYGPEMPSTADTAGADVDESSTRIEDSIYPE